MSASLPLSPPIAVPADQRVRDRIRSDLGTTLIIEAAAGTGKTTALVSRIVALIASGRSQLDRVVAVTFTEKAAGELKLRLRAEIERARHQDPDPQARARLTSSLEKLEEARIGTIHGFCADLLRERPVEAAVDPMFEVAAEDATVAIFNAAFDRWFERALADPGEGLRRILRRPEVTDREGPRPLLRAAALELLEWRDFDAPWAHAPFERDREIDALVDEIEALGAIAAEGEPEDWLRRALEDLRRPISEATRLEAVRDRDYDALEAALLRLVRGRDAHWRWRGAGPRFGDRMRAEIITRRDALRTGLLEFRDRAGASLAPLLRDELWPVVEIYRELKQRAGRLDFLDLLLTARNLVRDNAAVRGELQQRFTHIFVDEFQDTDPLQAEILMLLAADNPAETNWLEVIPGAGKLFIVGDPKQSIYRFRRADVALYQEIKRRLLERGAALENLTVSFRATPEIQSMVNAAFAPAMATESPTQPKYVKLEPFRADHTGQPALIALPVPNPYSKYGRITDWSIEDSLPDAIAALIKWLVEESGWSVTEREAPERRVPIRPRHICILFRRMNAYSRDVTRAYVRALEARHVPHVLVRGGSFHMREEVETIRNALAAIERPDDELAMFATLHGALFAIADGALLRYREAYRSLNPFHRPDDLPAPLKEVADALAIIGGLHRGRNRRPIAETIARLLAATRAHAGFAIWPTGDQALANVMRLMDMARRYESISGATSMRGFVEDLEERAGLEKAGEVPVVEEGTEGVRIMTVHRAKGLEFPVVVLADITCNETAAEAHRFVDPKSRLCAQRIAGQAPGELLEHADEELRRDEEEAVRLLYVAATRARDLIVAPVVGDERHDGWIARLNPALYPEARNSRAPLERRPVGCPEFHSELAGVRPENAFTRAPGVTPGLHRPETGAHRVVWWDSSILALDARETMGLTQTKLLEADARMERSERGDREYAAWRSRRDNVIAAGSAPALRVVSATELSAGAAGAGAGADTASAAALAVSAQIEIECVPRAATRPRGKRFGTLIHAILAQVALDATPEGVASSATFFGRIFNASENEVAAAIATVGAALASPLMRRAAAATVVRREAPMVAALLAAASAAEARSATPSTLVEGVADLAFIEQHGGGVTRWVVVDFKTDFELDRRAPEYRIQLALYMRAISQATAMPTVGYLLLI